MIRVKGTITKGKLMLSEPLPMKEGMEFDVIAYIDRTTGESFDKKAKIIDLDDDYNSNDKENTVSVGSTGRFIKYDDSDNSGKLGNNNTKISITDEESIQYKINKFIDSIDITTLISFLEEEHPQLIAIITEMMERDMAKLFLEKLPPKLQGEVIYRIARQQKVSSDVLKMIYEVLNKKLSHIGKEVGNPSGGMESAITLLNMINKNSEKNAIDYIDSINKEFGDEIKKKLLKFEDILSLNNESVSELINNMDIHQLALSMKGIDKDLREKVINRFKNENKRNELINEIKNLGPVHIALVEKAQEDIILMIRKMEDEGKLVIKTKDIIE